MAHPKLVRLQTDFEKVQKLIAESGGSLRLIRSVGQPPTNYVIEYNCPSLVKDNTGRIITHSKHLAEIILGANYPLEKPTARMLTSIFNPHVFQTNAICLGGVWTPGETLDLLVLRIGALLQLDPRVLDFQSPANAEANNWVHQNRAKLPLGNVAFKAPPKPAKRIQWN